MTTTVLARGLQRLPLWAWLLLPGQLRFWALDHDYEPT